MEKDLITNSSFDADFEKYEKSSVELNIHASRKVKVIGRNEKPH